MLKTVLDEVHKLILKFNKHSPLFSVWMLKSLGESSWPCYIFLTVLYQLHNSIEWVKNAYSYIWYPTFNSYSDEWHRYIFVGFSNTVIQSSCEVHSKREKAMTYIIHRSDILKCWVITKRAVIGYVGQQPIRLVLISIEGLVGRVSWTIHKINHPTCCRLVYIVLNINPTFMSSMRHASEIRVLNMQELHLNTNESCTIFHKGDSMVTIPITSQWAR